MLRWSDAWEVASLEHFMQKWDLTKKDKYFKKRYSRLGQRRHQAFLRPLVKQLSFGGYATWLEKTLVAIERKINRYISNQSPVMVENFVDSTKYQSSRQLSKNT